MKEIFLFKLPIFYIICLFLFYFLDSTRNPREWCKLAYWEMAQRVGSPFPVEQPYVNVFGNIPIGDGFSLDALTQCNNNASDSVTRTRCKIGLGKHNFFIDIKNSLLLILIIKCFITFINFTFNAEFKKPSESFKGVLNYFMSY